MVSWGASLPAAEGRARSPCAFVPQPAAECPGLRATSQPCSNRAAGLRTQPDLDNFVYFLLGS